MTAKKFLIWIIAIVLLVTTVTAYTYDGVDVPEGLQYFSMDDTDTSGATSIDAWGNHNGTIVALTTGVAGKVGEAYNNTQTGGADPGTVPLTFPDLGVSGGATNFTTCAWLYLRTSGDYNQVWWNTGNENNVPYRIQAGPVIDGFMDIGGAQGVNSDTIGTGTWQHTCRSYDTVNGQILYWNGNQNDTDSTTGSVGSVSATNCIFSDRNGNNHFGGTMDELVVFDYALNSTQVEGLYNHQVNGYRLDENSGGSSPTTDVDFTIDNVWTGSAISNFSINITWSNATTTSHTTTNGTVSLINITAGNINATYWNMTDFFDKDIQETLTANVSNSIGSDTYQAYFCLNASAKVSEAWVTADNFTINSTTETSCFEIDAGTHNTMAQKSGWYNKNQSFTIAALSNATYTVANMSSAVLTIFAQDITTGAYLSNYQLNLTSLNYTGWAGDHYASTTNQTFDLINGTYNVAIDATGYALQDAEANISVTGDTNYTFQLYPTNSLNITFLDEDDGSTLSGPNITFEIILDDANASIGWTTNGTYWIDNLDSGSYEIRYRATAAGYGERSYYFTLTNRTYNALSLYLLNDTSTESITTTLYDEYGNTLEGYVVRLLRYYASLNGYVVVDEGQTNSEGQTVVSAIRNGPYYKFRIVNPSGTVLKTTSSTQIYDTSISLYVTLGEGIGQQLENLNDISYELVWLNASSQFRFTWDAASGLLVSATTYVYEVDALNGDTLYNSSTSTSASGTMYVSVARTNDTTYKAMSYVTFTDDTEATLLDTLTVTFEEVIATFGKLGLFLTFIIVITFALTGVFNPAAPCILVPLSLIITRIARLHALEWTWIVAITAVGAIILYIIRDKT